ncbi:prephenate dehydratase [Cysteiniphilum litorale]|uniref:prephenate dehydratase n=1 Tax=Cysteiniphilum litorale TaxID=2056700 RepID=UPI003F8850EB
MSLVISFQGEKGAYSEQAIHKFYQTQNKKNEQSAIETLACDSFAEALEMVAEKKADFAMIPVENSIAGSVIPAYDELIKYNLRIQHEVILKVEHCLMIHPNADIDNIDLVRSHPQALAQCQNNIARMHLSPKSFVDTAGAAKYIAEKEILTQAAIASKLAAQTYSLKVIKEHFEDEPFNFTRFFLLGRDALNMPYAENELYKSSIIFTTLHKPNALVQVLACLSEHNINMCKIESRPSRSRAWDYSFFVDFEGHEEQQNVQAALLAILKKTSFLKNLGCYQSIML